MGRYVEIKYKIKHWSEEEENLLGKMKNNIDCVNNEFCIWILFNLQK